MVIYRVHRVMVRAKEYSSVIHNVIHYMLRDGLHGMLGLGSRNPAKLRFILSIVS